MRSHASPRAQVRGLSVRRAVCRRNAFLMFYEVHSYATSSLSNVHSPRVLLPGPKDAQMAFSVPLGIRCRSSGLNFAAESINIGLRRHFTDPLDLWSRVVADDVTRGTVTTVHLALPEDTQRATSTPLVTRCRPSSLSFAAESIKTGFRKHYMALQAFNAILPQTTQHVEWQQRST